MLIGNALKASVETTDLAKLDSVDFYFPEGVWCQLIPTLQENFTDCFDYSSAGKNVSLRSHMEDYYLHLRNGYIVPNQNASVHGTNRTKDQLNQYTDLLILPNAANADTVLRNQSKVSAAAFGYIYLDDGVSLVNNYTVIDFTYMFGGSGTGASETEATITFDTSGDNYTNPLAINEMCGNITIFNPMRDAVPDMSVAEPVAARAVKSVTGMIVTDEGGDPKSVTLSYSYLTDDSNSQVLKIIVSDGEDKQYKFSAISSITITYDAPA